MSSKELWALDVTDLQSRYTRETEKLHKLLLEGVDWEQTAMQRQKIAAVYSVLYKKLNPSQFENPAENNLRPDQS
jgi:hypothetical protein